MNNNIIERGIEAESILNFDETLFGHESSTKRVIDVKGSRNVWEN